MNNQLRDGLYLYPTPGGAYYAVASTSEDKSRQFLQKLLSEKETSALTLEALQAFLGTQETEKNLEFLHHCQNLGWVQGLEESITNPQGALEDILPGMLLNICENGKILLADDQGFYLASNGFPHEVAEELSALSAEIATMYQRRSGLLINNLGMASSAWAIIDASGNSKIGFWPLYIGKTRFVLILSGVPHFNHPDFVSLIWALSIRYARKSSMARQKASEMDTPF